MTDQNDDFFNNQPPKPRAPSKPGKYAPHPGALERKPAGSGKGNPTNSAKQPSLLDAAFDMMNGVTKSMTDMMAPPKSNKNVIPANKGGSVNHYTKSSYAPMARCADTHPPLKLPGSDLVIYGGSCSHPVVEDADVYIGFDSGMKFTQRHWPWKKGDEILFYIQDMGVPASPEEFKKLLAWTKQQLEGGRKVHCGCIGGHGRTGTFLAALCSMFGETDAITYVRANYCKKAVESSAQIDFLHTHFGITKVAGSKVYSGGAGTGFKSTATDPNRKKWSAVSNEYRVW